MKHVRLVCNSEIEVETKKLFSNHLNAETVKLTSEVSSFQINSNHVFLTITVPHTCRILLPLKTVIY